MRISGRAASLDAYHELAEFFGLTRDELEPLKEWARGQAPYSIKGWNLIQGHQAIPIG
jgi:hypothetical protein